MVQRGGNHGYHRGGGGGGKHGYGNHRGGGGGPSRRGTVLLAWIIAVAWGIWIVLWAAHPRWLVSSSFSAYDEVEDLEERLAIAVRLRHERPGASPGNRGRGGGSVAESAATASPTDSVTLGDSSSATGELDFDEEDEITTAAPTDTTTPGRSSSADDTENEWGDDNEDDEEEDDDDDDEESDELENDDNSSIHGAEEDEDDRPETLPPVVITKQSTPKKKKKTETGSSGSSGGSPVPIGSNPLTILGGTNPDHPRFLFVHVGKAGGTTAYSNIRTLCVRKNTEKNIVRQRQHKTAVATNQTGYKGLNNTYGKRTRMPCVSNLVKQNDPRYHDPPTEMAISRENMVHGYLHMNMARYWWNANDDGEAINLNSAVHNIQDEVTAVLSQPGGEANAYDIRMLADPPDPANNPADDGVSTATAFLFPVRDPIDRLVSAFNYHHPDNHITSSNCESLTATEEKLAETFRDPRIADRKKVRKKPIKYWVLQAFYCRCFPTVNDLADAFRPGHVKATNKTAGSFRDPTVPVPCSDVARLILRGTGAYKMTGGGGGDGDGDRLLGLERALDLRLVNETRRESNPMVGHVTLNYGYYYRRTLAKHPSKDVVALRTEHLWEDLQGLEILVGGNATIHGTETGHKSQTHGSSKFVRSATIDGTTTTTGDDDETGDGDGLAAERTRALCCAIASEIAIYRELIERATNLSGEQKKESLDALADKCGDDMDRCGGGGSGAAAATINSGWDQWIKS